MLSDASDSDAALCYCFIGFHCPRPRPSHWSLSMSTPGLSNDQEMKMPKSVLSSATAPELLMFLILFPSPTFETTLGL